MTIYLDHNATTPILPEVVEAMLPYLREHFGNPSSSHSFGQRARAAVDVARAQVAELLGCSPDEVIFTSGGTEANNLAIRGVADASVARRNLITSKIEHPATTRPCSYLAEHGWRVEWVGVDRQCRIDPLAVREVLEIEKTALVTVMHANNETGTVQPVAEIAELAHERGALVHTDAAQTVGKARVRVNDLHVDLLTVAGHKLNAPKGVGALFVRRGTRLSPFVLGAGHENGLRPGTENVASIVGLGVACALAHARIEDKDRRLRELCDQLWTLLAKSIPHLKRNGHPTECLPNTLSVRFPGARGSSVLGAAEDVAASTGSACHEGAESASTVLLAMGLDPTEALETVRLSVGVTTSDDDVERGAAALVRSWNVVRGST